MKLWLEKECSELKDLYLLDEHRTIHAYIGAMTANPQKWLRNSLIKGWDPKVIEAQHTEQVLEMKSRGFKHNTPITEDIILKCVAAKEKYSPEEV